MNIFQEQFAAYVCSGDTISAEHDGFQLVATIHDDNHHGAPWEDEWRYVGVSVTVSRNGVELVGEYECALWGIAANYPNDDNSYLADVANEWAEEALESARAKLASLCECEGAAQ